MATSILDSERTHKSLATFTDPRTPWSDFDPGSDLTTHPAYNSNLIDAIEMNISMIYF